MIGQRPPGNESHHHKTRDCEQFSWVPLPYCSRPGCPFPIKSLALSAHVSSRTIHFRVLDKSPVSGPGRGPPSCNKCTMKDLNTFNFCPYLTTVNNLWTSSGAQIILWVVLYWTPLQDSCLENPMDGGVWWAAIHGVAKSRTQLKRLSSSSSSTVLRTINTTFAF